MLEKKDMLIRRLRGQIRDLEARTEGMGEEIVARDTVIMAQRTEIQQSKRVMEARISHLEGIVNSARFLESTFRGGYF